MATARANGVSCGVAEVVLPRTMSLEEILTRLEPRGEARLGVGDFPLDEVLLLLHETRFSGSVEIGRVGGADRLSLRGGHVLDVAPPRFLHVKLLTEVLVELGFVSGGEIRSVLEADAALDGELLGLRLAARALVTHAQLREAVHEQSRRRLFDLYDHHTGEIVVRRDQPKTSVIDPLGVDVLPAVAYGIVVRASPRRRQAMLAFAAGKRVTLTVDYDAARNRCGLPPPLLEATKLLSTAPVTLGPVPCLPGLAPDSTAGLLLLFMRLSLLSWSDPWASTSASDTPLEALVALEPPARPSYRPSTPVELA